MPALQNTFLFIEPMQHSLNYGSIVLHQIIEANKRPEQTITELIGNDATPENTLEKLRTMQPILFALVGHGNCYSDDTEILTENGWKFFYELDPREKVATLSEDGELKYDVPTAHYKFEYKGKMLSIDGRRINLLVTPNHNLYCSWPIGKKGWTPYRFIQAQDIGKAGVAYQIGTDEKSKKYIELEKKTWELRNKNHYGARRISRLLGIKESTVNDWLFYGRKAGKRLVSTGTTTGCYLRFKRSARWNCQQLSCFQLASTEKIEHHRQVTVPSKNIPIEDWLRFFGIWIAEGSASLGSRKGEYIISITQNNEQKRAIIKKWVASIADRVGFSAWEEKSNEHSKAIKFKNKQVFDYLKHFGHSQDKYIPKEIKMLPPNLLNILFEAMVLGDGFKDPETGEISYATKSKKLADDVQEIALKLGCGATISMDKRTGVYCIGITKTEPNVTKRSRKWVDYDGCVYSVTVPNHLIYVRRNGKPCWSGNSDVTSVECTAVLVRSDSPELELFKDKIVSLTSCLTAQILGPAIIDAGAEAYTGYKEEFWFFIGDEAGTTPAVRSPFVAEFQFVASLLQGKSVSDARKDQLAKFDEEIAYWTSGAGKNDVNSMELSRILEMNKSNSVFLGVGTVTPSPTVSVSQATMGNPIVYAITLPLMALIIYRELKT